MFQLTVVVVVVVVFSLQLTSSTGTNNRLAGKVKRWGANRDPRWYMERPSYYYNNEPKVVPKNPAPPPPPPEVTKVKVVGCYTDSLLRDLDGAFQHVTSMTLSSCAKFCSLRGFKFAGAQLGTECRCGNSYGRHGESVTP